MDVFIVQSKQVNSGTHISFAFVPHTLPPLNPITISLKTHLVTDFFFLNLRIIMDRSLNFVENVSLQY